MASPNAAGSLLLVQEYYNQKHPGIFMKGATLKALAIHTADEAGPSNGPDYQYGYGLLNVLKATSVIT
ncbi:S8 family serine peptidase, partial [Enterococcus faecalis]|uniref:S8 family serine peptidase n=1 Tax=Enterococcus faecalis TaxID=1351 RepID=UPI00403F4462